MMIKERQNEFLFSFRHYVCALDAYSLLLLHLAPLDGWIGSTNSTSKTRTILRHYAAPLPSAVVLRPFGGRSCLFFQNRCLSNTKRQLCNSSSIDGRRTDGLDFRYYILTFATRLASWQQMIRVRKVIQSSKIGKKCIFSPMKKLPFKSTFSPLLLHYYTVVGDFKHSLHFF